MRQSPSWETNPQFDKQIHCHLRNRSIYYSVRKNSLSPRFSLTFHGCFSSGRWFFFKSENLLVIQPQPEVNDHPLSVVGDSFWTYSVACMSGGRLIHPQPEKYAVWQGFRSYNCGVIYLKPYLIDNIVKCYISLNVKHKYVTEVAESVVYLC